LTAHQYARACVFYYLPLQFLLLPRATTSLFYPIFVWLDEVKLACMGAEWWEHSFKKITQLDATLLTIGVSNEVRCKRCL
jgi:hypothetical protein